MALNGARKPNRGLAFENDLETYNQLITEQWLADLVSDIRNGHDELKSQLPLRCSHYYRFRNNHRSQADMDPESFLFQTCVDIDDADIVEQTIARARELNEGEGEWHDMLLHMEYSARKKLHIDIRIPVGMTIVEAQQAYCQALGVDYDGTCVSPERFILITDASQVIYTSEHWYEVLSDGELQLRRKIYEQRGLTIDGRRLKALPGQERKSAPLSEGELDFQPVASPIINNVEADPRCLRAFDLCMAEAGLTEKQLQVVGVRHNSLLSIFSVGACRLMTIEQMKAVVATRMPGYATEKDCQQLISDFYANYTEMNRPMTRRLREIHAEAFAEKASEDKQEASAEVAVVEPQKKKRKMNMHKLPAALRDPVLMVPEEYQMSVLCAILPLVAVYLDMVRFQYADGKIHHLGLMSMIVAKQAGGKSYCLDAVNTWLEPLNKLAQEARAREDAVREKNKLRKANERAIEMPKEVIQKVPFTISNSAMLKRLKNAQGHCLYSFCEELDTVLKTNSAGCWSSKLDLYRYAFDRGVWGQDYNSDQAESGEVNVAYNWTALGTYGAFYRLFGHENSENGLAGRILFSALPDNSFAKLPKYKLMTQEQKEAIWKEAERLQSMSGLVKVPRLNKAIEEWLEEKRIEAMKNMDTTMDDLRKRAAVIATRCGVIFHLMERKTNVSKSCVENMLALADHVLENQMMLIGEAMELQQQKHMPVNRLTINRNTYDCLPEVFTIDDLRASKSGQYQESTYRSIISRWTKEGLVERMPQQELDNDRRPHWRKLSATMAKSA